MLAATSIATATSAGITAAGWRAPAPFFGVTTNEPFLPAPCRSVESMWIQKFAADSAKAANV